MSFSSQGDITIFSNHSPTDVSMSQKPKALDTIGISAHHAMGNC